jgi:hypothetical protein
MNLGLRAIRIPVCVQCIGTVGGCGLQGRCYVYDSVCHAEGFGLLLAKGCDRRSDPLNTKTSPEAFGIHQSDSCLCLIRDVGVKLVQAGFGDNSWLALVRAS